MTVAFKTLDQLRSTDPGLNSELGLADDNDNSFGTTARRNSFIQQAIRKLWPRMALLTRETITTVTDQMEYTLTTLEDVERLEVIDVNTGTLRSDRIRSWQLYSDRSAVTPVVRLLIPKMVADVTIYAIGYRRYTVPATGSDSCNIEPELEHVVLAGARAQAYRAAVGKFMNFERLANENRANAITAGDIAGLYRDAQAEFDRLIRENGRELSGAHRAQLQTG